MHNSLDYNMVSYLNDIPVDSGTMQLWEAQELSVGSIIQFELKDDINDEKVKELITIAKSSIKALTRSGKEDIKFDGLTFEIARDVVSITKILVKRQGAFIRLFEKSFDESSYYNYLASVQTKLEYFRLRKMYIAKCYELMQTVLQNDIEYYKKISNIFKV